MPEATSTAAASPAPAASAPAPSGGSAVAAATTPASTTTAATPPAAPAPAAANDDAMYDAAFSSTIGKDLSKPATPAPAQAEADAEPAGSSVTTDSEPDGADAGEGGSVEDAQPAAQAGTWTPTPAETQLLRRNHLSPELLAGWTPEQRQAFLTNAAKREADQTRTFSELKTKLQQYEQGGKPAGEGDPKPGEANADPTNPANAGLVQRARGVIDKLAEVYGDEIKPLGDVVDLMGSEIERLGREASAVPLMQSVTSELVVELGLRDLSGEYPSVNTTEGRQQVLSEFDKEWKSGAHRQPGVPFREQVRSALARAAKVAFTPTQQAAQAALAEKTKTRLKAQPRVGAPKGNPKPMSEDEVYDKAFQETLGK